MNKINKYKEHFSGLIFSAYLFFFILNIFHYHQVNLSPEFQVKSEKESQKNNPDLYYLDLNVICKFQSTLSSIQTAVDFNNFFFLSDNNLKGLSFYNEPFIQSFNNFTQNYLLRSPPSR
jgi:hypothetical protein